MPDAQKYAEWIVQNRDKAGTPEFDAVAKAYRESRRQPLTQVDVNGPQGAAAGMSDGQKFFAGVGKGMTDIAQGVGQVFGLQSREDVAEKRALDADLAKTGAGKAGEIVGQVATALPTMFIPGANTVIGGAAIGAGLGLAQPSVSTDETLKNTTLGAGGGAAGVLLGRAVPQVVRGLTAPFTKSGRNQLAGDTLRRFAGDNVDDVIRAAQNPQQFVQGSAPTLAEVAQNPGISNLQQAMKGLSPTVGNNLGERSASNMVARTSALRGIAGTADDMAMRTTARDVATRMFYDAADNANVPVTIRDRAISNIMERPSVQRAWAEAERLAQEEGIKTVTSKGELTGSALHFLKKGLDKQISGLAPKDPERAAILNTKNAIQSWMEKNIPDYGIARRGYAQLSKPINEMEVGKLLLDKLEPSLMKYAETPTRETASTFAKALQDAPRTIKSATGMQFNKLSDVMRPQSVEVVEGIAKDLARKATSEDMARAVGSNTAQNIASQNLVRNILGPMGLPQSWSESILANSVARPVQWAMRGAESGIQDVIGDALLDPRIAAQLMQGARPAPTGLLGQMYQRSLPAIGGGILSPQGQQ